MRIKDPRFSVPFCIFEDELPDKAFVLLVLLFSRSDCSGKVAIGYDEMMKGANIGSRNTVANCLTTIREHGWIEHKRRRGGQVSTFFLQVPEQYHIHKPRKNIVYLKWKTGRKA